MGHRSLILLVFVSAFTAAHAATIVWTNTAGGGWNEATNWSPNVVPGSGDTVEITNDASYTVNVDGVAKAGSIDLGTADVGSTNIQAFQLTTGNTFTLSGPATVSTNGQFNLFSGVMIGTNAVLDGTFNGNAATVSGTFTILSNSVLNINPPGVIFNGFPNLQVVTNYGTVNWNAANVYEDNNGVIFNYGLWLAQTDGTINGRLESGNGAFENYGTFRKSGGTNTTLFDGNGTFNNYGEVDIQTGTLNVQRGQDSGWINTSNSTILTFANFILAGTNLFTGGGVLTNGFLVGSNAVMEGTLACASPMTIGGTLTIDSSAELQILSGAAFDGFVEGHFTPCLFTNNGTVLWITNDINNDNLPTIDNYGLWVAQGDNTFFGRQVSGPTTFNNYGTFKKLGTSGTTTIDANTIFNNLGGTVQTASGTIGIQYGNGYGTFDTASNSLLQLTKFNFMAGSVFTNKGTVSGLLEATNAMFNGTLNLANSTMSGIFTLESGCGLNIGSGVVFNGFPNATTITNYGTVVWATGNITDDNGPTIDNYGLWLAENDGTFNGRFSGGITTFNNLGTFRKLAGSGGSTTLVSFQFNNSGLLDVQTGQVAIASSYVLGAGTLNFGINSVTNYGSINFSGSVALSGTVSANLNGLYGLGAGSSLAVVTYSSKSGTFTNFNLPTAFVWTNSYGGSVFSLVIAAAPSLNVTNFGAIGDAVQFFVNTVSNSVLVTTTNQLSNAAIGEAIEVFGAGTPTTQTNNQDLITTISNVVNGTNIFLWQACQQNLTNTFATYGHNNTANFQTAITAVGSATNAVINVPAGTYLLLATNHNGVFGHSSILLQRGGINFVGAGTNSTSLLSQGAWTLINSNATRGFLIELAGPMTNVYPISFSYLTMDGGVQHGNTSIHGFPASAVTGNGWDETHDAVLSWIVGVSPSNFPNAYYTNDLVQHWRGEEFKSIDQPANCRIGIYGCTFSDGNATALNIYPTWDVESNVFANLFQIAEYYQAYYSYPACFAYNVITNITGNGFAVNGGSGTNQPLTIASNIFYFSATAVNGIETLPGDNISIIGNQFIVTGQSGDQVITIGAPGYQGTFCNSNILISGNNFNGGSYLIVLGANAPDNAVNVMVCSNNWTFSSGSPFACISYGMASNVIFSANSFPINSRCQWLTGVDQFNNPDGQFALVDSNNIYDPFFYSPSAAITNNSTNIITYANGLRYSTATLVQTNVTFVLEDSNSNQIPTSAQIIIDNSINSGKGTYTIFFDRAMTRFIVVAATNKQINIFNWVPGFGWNYGIIATNGTTAGPLKFTAKWTGGAVPFVTQFNSPSVDSLGYAITGWNWNFGDGTTGSSQTPLHTYTTAGIYTPSLVVTNINGVAEIVSGPSINATALPVSQHLAMALSGANVTMVWPTNATGYLLYSTTNLTAEFWTPMSASVVTNNGQRVLSVPMVGNQMYFRLLQAGTITFKARWSAGAAPFATEFSSPPVDSLGYAITGWSWNFGDGSNNATSTLQNPPYTYYNPGTFAPSLIVTNINGIVELASGPAINAGILPVSQGLAVELSGANLNLTWPTNATGYILMTATNLASPIWVPDLALPVILNGQNVLNIPLTGGQMYFWLSP